MNSIKKKLSRYLSISISVLLVLILLATDISVDTWIGKEFDRAMINKSSLLITLVDQDVEEIDFDFADEFMPEFSGANDPEYFQLWLNNNIFERSKTLNLFAVNELPKVDVQQNKSNITDITLPDGRSGRMITTKFMPQVDSDIRAEFGISAEEFSKTQQPMVLAYATSIEGLNQIEWFVDIIFIISSISTVIVIRMIVSNVVDRGLRPLDKLNNEILHINLNSAMDSISTDNLPTELVPIATGINHFLNQNKILYAREKRLTSDIAHELKTPITELINLSEVALKFPHEKKITDTFTSEVLGISERLKSIVNGILLLQKSSSNIELKKDKLNIAALIRSIIERENKADREIELMINYNEESIFINQFAIETILSNLINNALYYSPADTPVSISVDDVGSNNKQVKISITNMSVYQYCEQELDKLFDPLWQKDSSRTSSQRYGLGLAIVKSYCDKLNAELTVTLAPQNKINFSIII